MDNETKQLWNVIEKNKEELVGMLTEKLRENAYNPGAIFFYTSFFPLFF